LFIVDSLEEVSVFIQRVMFYHNIIYEDNVFLAVEIENKPFGHTWGIQESGATGIRLFRVRKGFMEVIDLPANIREAGIEEKVIFYGEELVSSKNPFWGLFSAIERMEINESDFFFLPDHKVHGVVVKVTV